MAYGDYGPSFDEMEHTEFLFRMGDLVDEWFKTLAWHSHPERVTDTSRMRADLDRAEDRLEEMALELLLHLKARRGGREAANGTEGSHLRPIPGREEGAA